MFNVQHIRDSGPFTATTVRKLKAKMVTIDPRCAQQILVFVVNAMVNARIVAGNRKIFKMATVKSDAQLFFIIFAERMSMQGNENSN